MGKRNSAQWGTGSLHWKDFKVSVRKVGCRKTGSIIFWVRGALSCVSSSPGGSQNPWVFVLSSAFEAGDALVIAERKAADVGPAQQLLLQLHIGKLWVLKLFALPDVFLMH